MINKEHVHCPCSICLLVIADDTYDICTRPILGKLRRTFMALIHVRCVSVKFLWWTLILFRSYLQAQWLESSNNVRSRVYPSWLLDIGSTILLHLLILCTETVRCSWNSGRLCCHLWQHSNQASELLSCLPVTFL